MEFVETEALTIVDTNALCPRVLIEVLKKKPEYATLQQVTPDYPLGQLIYTINSFLNVRAKHLIQVDSFRVIFNKLNNEKGDGFLVLNKSGYLHVVGFITVNKKLTLYDPRNGSVSKFSIKPGATAEKFSDDFSRFFPGYSIVIGFFIAPVTGGKRKRRKTRRKKSSRKLR
jgi:hypothetical protein